MKWKVTRRFDVFCVLTIAWMAVIFLFSAQNGDESSGLSAAILAFLCRIFDFQPLPDTESLLLLLIRKGAHMTEFGILALLWLGTLRCGFGQFRWNYPVAFAAASLYAATDEIHQLFVSDRAGRVTDWLIDSTGAFLFLLLAWCVVTIRSRRRQKKTDCDS